ncbi:MAG TPA: glycosyltransferase [Bryobacteraceae bacterium]|nr:glycosyltransferase [Bryobacteraceae bacterium]
MIRSAEPDRVGVCCLFRAYGGTAATLPQWLREWSRQILEQELPAEIYVYTCPQNLELLGQPGMNGIRIVQVPLAGRGVIGRTLAETLLLPFLLWRDRIQVALGVANTIPWLAGCPSAVIFQNAAPFVDQARNGGGSASFRLRMLLLRWAILLAAWRSRRVICISRWFRQHLSGFVPSVREKSAVIRHGMAKPKVEEASLSAAGARLLDQLHGRPFVLNVSHGYPYKNLIELVDGFDKALASLPGGGWRLVIAGELLVPGYRQALETAIGRSDRLKDAVILSGSLTEDEVAFFTQKCDIFAFSSCCENWPVALMNAVVAGAPVACSNAGVMPEVVGEAAAMFDPFSPASIAEVLRRLMSSEAERGALRLRSRERARQFHTVEQQAAEILDEVRALAAG